MPTPRLAVTLFCIAPLVAGLAACGSDSSSAPRSAVPTTDTIQADIASLGILSYDSVTTATDTTVTFGIDNDLAEQWVGWYFSDNGASQDIEGSRATMRFALPMLPGQGVVDSARVGYWHCGIYAYQSSSGRFDPFTVGHVTVDHVNLPDFTVGSATTFAGDILEANLGTIQSDSAIGVRTMMVTAAVKGDYTAKRSTSQFRLNWIFDTPVSASGGSVQAYAELGTECGETNGPPPFLVIWSH
jgi:hypothetical protein